MVLSSMASAGMFRRIRTRHVGASVGPTPTGGVAARASHRWSSRVRTAVALSVALAVLARCGGSAPAALVTPGAAVAEPQVLTRLSVALPANVLQASRTVPAAVVALDQHARSMTVGAPGWATDRPDIATVSADGVVSAWAVGQAVISAAVGDIRGQATITVTPPPSPLPVAEVTIDVFSATVETAHTLQLSATPRDFLGNPLSGRPVRWSTSDAAVAAVSASGLVTAIATGTAIIEAVSETQHGATALAVSAAQDPDIQLFLAAPIPNLTVGDTVSVVATVTSLFPLVSVTASVGGSAITLVSQPIGARGNGVGWVGTVNISTLAYGPYVLLVSATDTRGHVGTVTAPIVRNPKVAGGTKGPTANK